MTAFIGVRISWLIIARKALLAWLAAFRRRLGFLRLPVQAGISIAMAACWARPTVKSRSDCVNGPAATLSPPDSQHTDHLLAGFERCEHGRFPLFVGIRVHARCAGRKGDH